MLSVQWKAALLCSPKVFSGKTNHVTFTLWSGDFLSLLFDVSGFPDKYNSNNQSTHLEFKNNTDVPRISGSGGHTKVSLTLL